MSSLASPRLSRSCAGRRTRSSWCWRALELGMDAIGIADRNTLAGVVRMHSACKGAGLRPLIGCRLDLTDAPSLLAYPLDRDGYGRLSRLLSLGKMRAKKGECELSLADVAEHQEGIAFIAWPSDDLDLFWRPPPRPAPGRRAAQRRVERPLSPAPMPPSRIARAGECRSMPSSGWRGRCIPLDGASTAAQRCGICGRSNRRRICRCSLMPRRATRERRPSRRAPGHAAQRACGERLSDGPPQPEGASDALPARTLCRAEIRHRRPAETHPGRQAAVDRRAGADPSAAGQRQGRRVHHLEDETGIANLVVWPDVFDKQRKIVMGARLMAVHGIVQQDADGGSSTSSLGSWRITAHMLRHLSEESCPRRSTRATAPEAGGRPPRATRATSKSSPKAAISTKTSVHPAQAERAHFRHKITR